MAGRGPSILAGRILEQNAWLASSSSSPTAAQGISQAGLQLSAKRQLQGIASRKKGNRPSPYSCPPPQDSMDVDLGTEDAAPALNALEAGLSVTESGMASPSHSAHLVEKHLNAAMSCRYSRPNGPQWDTQGADGGEDEDEEDEEDEEAGCSNGLEDESESDSEDEFPGGIPSIWDLQEESFLKTVAEMNARRQHP
ncbi:hypothetical protein JOM56_009088 [Amanita muscaria]